MIWTSEAGLGLWASTVLFPAQGKGHASKEYWHRRYPSDRVEFGHKLNTTLSAGRYKEYRTPVQAHQTQTLEALCIGNALEVERLLAVVTHVGKKGSMGYGRVARWSVAATQCMVDQILAMRPVPITYYAGQRAPGMVALNRGWTPPYWYAPWWADCIIPE